MEWRDDPGWHLIVYDHEKYAPEDLVKPTPDAELANPPLWASLIVNNKIVATWWRPVVPTVPGATLVADE